MYKPELPARVGLLPHSATSDSEARWFELPSFMCFHTANAWEEGGKLRLFACCMREFDMGAKEVS